MYKMSNPFDTIESRLDKIESLLLAIKPQAQTTQNPKTEKPISQTEAVEFLGKTRQTLISWRKKGVIKAYHLGGRIYYKPVELLEALQKLG
jgi:hypothetical protein